MKVTGSQGSSSQTTSSIDLELGDLPAATQRIIKEEIGELIVLEALMAMGEAKSIVQGESFPRLSKNYKSKKVAEGGSSAPDLEVSGGLKDALTFKATDDGIDVGFFGAKADHADGHLKFSGRENATPQRRFLPGEGQTLKSNILQKVEDIIAHHSGSAFEKSDFSGVESSSDLYDILGETFSGMSKSQIRLAVASNPELIDLLIDQGLLGLL